MGWFTASTLASLNVANKAWNRNKEKVAERFAPRGGEAGKAYRSLRSQTAGVAQSWTEKAADAGVDKPGGDVQRFTNWGRDVWHKGETALFGKRDQRNEGGDGGGADEYLAGSRANYLRKGQYAKTDKFADRRSLDAFDTGTLLTQGQKAKKLKKA